VAGDAPHQKICPGVWWSGGSAPGNSFDMHVALGATAPSTASQGDQQLIRSDLIGEVGYTGSPEPR
jgi:hypothetical protein